MKNRILLFTALLAGCMLAVSCSSDEGGDGGGGKKGTTKTYGALNHLSITDAEYLYATTGGSSSNARTRSGVSASSQLFKITYNGETKEVAILDENGETVPVEDMKIAYANDDLVFFAFYYGIYETDKAGNIIQKWNDLGDDVSEIGGVSQAYLIRKSDGGVFVVPEMFYAAFGWYYQSWSGEQFGSAAPTKDMVARYDKNQNMYCQTRDALYKITSTNGISATKLIDLDYNSNEGYVVDWNGYVLYGNTQCLTPDGNTFKIDDINIHRYENPIIPFSKDDEGGFLYWEHKGWNGYEGNELSLYKYMVNESTQSADKDFLGNFTFNNPLDNNPNVFDPYANPLIILPNKIIFNDQGYGKIIVVRGYDDIKELDAQVGAIQYVSDNYIYWVDYPAGIKSLSIDTGATTTIHSFAVNRDYYNYSFADDVILFYATDKQSGDIYLCQIKDGVYSDKLIETGAGNNNTNSSPEIIDFVRVN